jgi:predicted nucleic-acid-binding Zn-ribbon protein
MKDGICPKCQGTIIIQGVRILDRQHGPTVGDLSLAVEGNPQAWIFKEQVQGKLWACVCAACGFVELYATNLDELLKAAVKGQPDKVTTSTADETPPDATDRVN